ncbi:MAG: transketolase [Gemmatimonadetes bacterium]|nr:transketolase [Gemmatimonadota bacterium]
MPDRGGPAARGVLGALIILGRRAAHIFATSTSRTAVTEPAGTASPSHAADWTAINALRVLAMDAVQAANSGHPGTPMALAPAAWMLWSRHLRHAPQAPDWADRDRFVLSCGHASMLLYGLLHLTGYDLPLEEIKAFRQWGSKTPGHPERGHTVGVETTTGPLGQGMANAVGMAIAERILRTEYGASLSDHRTWVIASDGDLMEGISSEAASLAGHLGLGRLTVIYDDNRITIEGRTDLAFSEQVQQRFEACGWRTLRVDDGNDLAAIDAALARAATSEDRPTLIVLKTVIGDPAPTKRDTAAAHGAPLGADEVARTKEILGWDPGAFVVPDAAYGSVERLRQTGAELVAAWEARLGAHERREEFVDRLAGRLPEGWQDAIPDLSGQSLATRQASKKALGALAQTIPALVGGSADLGGSNGTDIEVGGTFGPAESGRRFHWGIREHAMAAACNGLAAHGGFRPYAATFLVFADYCKPSIRLAALMGLPVTYVFTHDSIGVGEDGPTHQPIEHLAMLRSIPGMTVFRPADAAETAVAWRAALEQANGPTALVLTRQTLPALERSAGPVAEAMRGGYILHEPATTPVAVILATGSEVSVAVAAASQLDADGIPTRVVSLPSWERFQAQDAAWRERVLPRTLTARVSIEAASTFGWHAWVGDRGAALGIDHFGASAPGERLFTEFGITPERVVAAVRALT